MHKATNSTSPSRLKPRKVHGNLFPSLFMPLGILYLELLLKAFNPDYPFFEMALLRILLFSAAAGLLFYVLLDLIPKKKISRGIAIGIMAFGTVFTCIEYCCKSFFKTYFGLGYMQGMAGQVVGDFFGLIVEVVLARIPFILLSFVPLIVVILLRKKMFPNRGQPGRVRLLAAVLLVLFQLAGFLLSNFGAEKNFYTYDFATDASIPHFGVVTSIRLELEYALFGTPEPPLPVIDLDPVFTPDPTPTPTPSNDPVVSPDPTQSPDPDTSDVPTEEPSPEPSEEPEPTPIVYGYNVLDIDFSGLASTETNKTLASMHQYFAAITPTQQNEYTGYFEGKNLILITAEAFSPYAINEELTPTLYKLANEGFVFNNYYQPDWTMSTTGGEFAVMTGIIPNWVNGSVSFSQSASKNMATGLGWLFRDEGYTTTAYHNNTYTYYNRNLTHANLGYDFIGIGNGLELPSNLWPNSDLEMFQATVDGYVNEYVENGTNFHTYYMTVSGHCNYNWGGNAMSRKHRAVAEAAFPDSSQTIQAYIACNLEVEYALAYLMEQLEAAGIADDTVIVLTSDHYPYGMLTDEADYYQELSGTEYTERDTQRFRNTLIMWCGSMEEPVIVDTPCSSIDIVPTICNLFGLDYDSRLYSGRDIFATNYVPYEYSTNMPLVVFAATTATGYRNSWITDAGVYNAADRVFTPNPGVEVASNYVSRVNNLVQAKCSYAKLIIQYDYYSLVLDDPRVSAE